MHEDAKAIAEGASAKRVPDAYCEHCNGTRWLGGMPCPLCGIGSAADPTPPETRECEGCGLYKPIEEMSTVFLPGTGESYQCEQCRGGP